MAQTLVYEIGLLLFVATYQQITRQLWLLGWLTTESRKAMKNVVAKTASKMPKRNVWNV